jgi:hypothetical protein
MPTKLRRNEHILTSVPPQCTPGYDLDTWLWGIVANICWCFQHQGTKTVCNLDRNNQWIML